MFIKMEHNKFNDCFNKFKNVYYYIHQDDLNKLDMSHKRIEKWIVFIFS